MINHPSLEDWDAQDPLAPFKDKFVQQAGEIYLDGNSLGKMPLAAQATLENVLQEQWGQRLIRSWNEQWLDLPLRIADKYARFLGVSAAEIIIGESTSVRLYQIIHALLSSKQYDLLLTDTLNFPTDAYVLEGLAQAFNLPKPITIDYGQDLTADVDRLKEYIKTQPGIICLSLVTYKAAYYYPMKELNQWAAKHQSIIVWDLSHAVGAVPIDLANTQTLVAIGCSYKFMNGGPGAPAFMYISTALQEELNNPIQGWFGHANPFDFSPTYQPAPGIDRFAAGTPQILSLAAMEAGIDISLAAQIARIRQKSVQQTEYVIVAVKQELIPLGFTLISPEQSSERGSHVAISHPQAWQICQALLQGTEEFPSVIPDFRPPNIIRLGIAPLYISFQELGIALKFLKTIVEQEWHLKFNDQKPKVT